MQNEKGGGKQKEGKGSRDRRRGRRNYDGAKRQPLDMRKGMMMMQDQEGTTEKEGETEMFLKRECHKQNK